MAFVHGKSCSFTVATKDVSPFTNSVEMKRSADSHDTSTFGGNSKTYAGGLKDGTATASGIYDNTTLTGPRNSILPLLGTSVTCIYGPEGATATKPKETFTAVVTSYEESVPVADMITWTAELQISGDVTTAVYP
jgi:hypothetical protein